MCGIAGLLTRRGIDPVVLDAMTDAISHRGPDGCGVWTDVEAGIALGHRRLSIIDLSAAGAQPMASRCGRYVVSYNGEIYNHLAVRAELDAGARIAWKGHSDTETLIEAISRWGLDAALPRMTGMFAIALWDCEARTLQLVRDRFGEKPLYYGWAGGCFAFGSELKALRALPGFDNEIDRRALSLYVRSGYVPEPWSIYRGIFKLTPGCIVEIGAGAVATPPPEPPAVPSSQPGFAVRRYWSLADVAVAGERDPVTDFDTARDLLEERLIDALRGQSIADVPLGAFLSGGIDSSTVVALMRAVLGLDVQTFTIGFEEERYSEADPARRIAKYLGTDHTEFLVRVDDTREVIPQLATMYDEPFADSSQIPTHLVSRLARGRVTVALSGDGGDELLGGYNRYVMSRRLWDRARRVPRPLRRLLGRGVMAVPPGAWDAISALPFAPKHTHLGNKAHKFARALGNANDLADLYRSFINEWPGVDDLVIGAPSVTAPYLLAPDPALQSDEHRMMYWDSLSYLPGDILCKVDRAAMAVSLETRVPFLDHRVAEQAWRTPIDFKIRGGSGKYILREILAKYVPRALFERPKAGFGVPVGDWIRTDLRDWAEDLLSEERLRCEGYFRPEPIRRLWAQHLSGEADGIAALWPILMFQDWRKSVDAT